MDAAGSRRRYPELAASGELARRARDAVARPWSHVRDYGAVSRTAVREMHRQVGNLVIDPAGLATRGLLVRHLVLPGDLAGSADTARFLVTAVSAATAVNVMAQYPPACKAVGHPVMGRRCPSIKPPWRRLPPPGCRGSADARAPSQAIGARMIE